VSARRTGRKIKAGKKISDETNRGEYFISSGPHIVCAVPPLFDVAGGLPED